MKNKDYKNGSIGDRFSEYEQEYRITLDHTKWTVFRLDGRGFSKFTKNFKEPFDDAFIKSMNNATIACFDSITNIKYGYTQSDEITIIFKPTELEEQMPFGGRIDKLISLLSSTVTGEFIRNLVVNNLFSISDLYDRKFPQFDCRYFQVDSEIEAINALITRQNDCKRNAIRSIGQYYYSHKELLGKNNEDVMRMLYSDHKIKIEDYHSHYILGRLIIKETETLINDEMEEYTRSKIIVEDNTHPFRKRFNDVFENHLLNS